MKEKPNYNPYEELANAIILLAVQDYRKAKAELNKHPFNHSARGMRTSVLCFFRSNWFKVLTNIDAETLIDRLNKEAV